MTDYIKNLTQLIKKEYPDLKFTVDTEKVLLSNDKEILNYSELNAYHITNMEEVYTCSMSIIKERINNLI